ncbi:MAG: flagellar export chaperone FlgN [Nitrospinaceae bacterium]
MQSKDSASLVLKLLREEKKCCDRLLEKLKEQTEAIEQDDESRLKEIIEHKDGCIRTTRDIEKELERTLGGLSAAEKEQMQIKAEGLIQELADVLEKIVELENNCQVELQARKFLVQDKLLDLKQGRTLLKGYARNKRVKPKISKNI